MSKQKELFLYEAKVPIVNRELKRKAEKETSKYHKVIEQTEERYIELLFEGENQNILYRWVQMVQRYWKNKVRRDIKIELIQPTDDDIFIHLKPEEKFSQTEFDRQLNTVTQKLRAKL